VQPHE